MNNFLFANILKLQLNRKWQDAKTIHFQQWAIIITRQKKLNQICSRQIEHRLTFKSGESRQKGGILNLIFQSDSGGPNEFTCDYMNYSTKTYKVVFIRHNRAKHDNLRKWDRGSGELLTSDWQWRSTSRKWCERNAKRSEKRALWAQITGKKFLTKS